VTAISRDGQRATVTIRYTVNPRAPRLSSPALSTHVLRAATTGGAVDTGGSKSGMTIRYSDTLGARTRLIVARCTDRQGGCRRLVVVGWFDHTDTRGTDRVKFTGRLNGRALSPGRYELRITAVSAGQSSPTMAARFTILPPAPICHDPDHDNDCDPAGQV
jgi:hypothetical protein